MYAPPRLAKFHSMDHLVRTHDSMKEQVITYLCLFIKVVCHCLIVLMDLIVKGILRVHHYISCFIISTNNCINIFFHNSLEIRNTACVEDVGAAMFHTVVVEINGTKFLK